MQYKRLFIVLCIGLLSLQFTGCGDKAAKKINTEAPREGRDRELYADALKSLERGRYEEGRLLLNTLISTYDGSVLLPLSKLLIADSFYVEGGSSNKAQAEVEYREWLQFFPNHTLADDVLLKIAEIHVGQVEAPDRDWTRARNAERELDRFKREYQQSELNPQVVEYLNFVREVLGKHELKIMRYNAKVNGHNGAINRGKNILKKYPEFSEMDEVLFLLGTAYVQKEDTPQAAEYFARLVREYPNSQFRDKAAEYLERFGLPVPEPREGAVEKVIAQKSMFEKFRNEVFGLHTKVSKNGIVLMKDGKPNDEVLAQFNLKPEDFTTPEATRTGTAGKVTTYNPNEPKQPEAAGDQTDKKANGATPTVKEKDKKKGGNKILGRG